MLNNLINGASPNWAKFCYDIIYEIFDWVVLIFPKYPVLQSPLYKCIQNSNIWKFYRPLWKTCISYSLMRQSCISLSYHGYSERILGHAEITPVIKEKGQIIEMLFELCYQEPKVCFWIWQRGNNLVRKFDFWKKFLGNDLLFVHFCS